MDIARAILEGLLGLVIAASGGAKVAGAKPVHDNLGHLGIRRELIYAIGVVEVLTGIGLLVGLFLLGFGAVAGVVLLATMAGAVLAHIISKDAISAAVPAAVLLVLAIALFALNWVNLTGLVS